jgi:hypothetical protein
VGGTTITNHESNHSLLDYVGDTLDYSFSNREQVLENKGYAPDTAGLFNSVAKDETGKLLNEGGQRRMARFTQITEGGKHISWKKTNGTGHFISKLSTDLINLPFGIVPGVSVRIHFTLNSSAFLLICDDPTAKEHIPLIQITSMILLVMERELYPDGFLAITKRITEKKEPTKQFIIQKKVDTYQIPVGGRTFAVDNFLGSSDTGHKIIIAIAETAALNGHYEHNPHYWARTWGAGASMFSVNEVIVSLDNTHLDGFQITSEEPQMVARLQWQRFCRFTGTMTSKVFCNGITYEEFTSNGG